MAGGDFIRRASGIYTPAIIGLSAAPWRFLSCPSCCTDPPCSACQDGTFAAAYGITLAGLTNPIIPYNCGGYNGDWVVEQIQDDVCTYYYYFVTPGAKPYLRLTIGLGTSINVLLKTNLGLPDTVALFSLTTGYDIEGKWDCEFSDVDIPRASGMPCSVDATATLGAA